MPYDPTRLSKVSIGWDSDETLGEANANDAGSAVLSIGYPGADITEVSTSTHDVDFGSVPAHDSSTLTVGVSNASRGDAFIVTPDSEWSGADYDLSLLAHSGDTTGEVTVAAVNSTATAHDPASTVFRLTRIAYSNYI